MVFDSFSVAVVAVTSLAAALLLWLVVIVFYRFHFGFWKFFRFPFSSANYYILMAPIMLGVIVVSITLHSYNLLVDFLVFAVVGVVGETLFSIWWRQLFSSPFWVYRVETLDHGYSSLLNFIPWGCGALIYLALADLFHLALPPKFLSLFTLSLGLSLAAQLLIFFLFVRRDRAGFRFRKLSLTNYLFFSFPLIVPIVVASAVYGYWVWQITLVFAVIATSAEYLFGRGVEILISKKLWIYNYAALDRGHFTPLSILLFAFVGFYFLMINTLL